MTTKEPRPRILVIAMGRWPVSARISLALGRAGFSIAAISPSGAPVRRVSSVDRQYLFRRRSWHAALIDAVEDWQPELLVCSDDRSVALLHEIHERLRESEAGYRKSLAALIETSLGDPASFEITGKKSKLVEFAASHGVRCPVTRKLSLADAAREIERIPYPTLLKADGSTGGSHVQLVRDAAEARRTICAAELPLAWPSVFRGWVARFIPLAALHPFLGRLRTICSQEIIAGPEANLAVACWQGELLAWTAVQVIESLYAFGPATLVNIVSEPQMIAAAEVLVRELKLSGLIGFDFIFDQRHRGFLIELNPRVTPTCYLRAEGAGDLCAALYGRLREIPPPPSHECANDAPIALFPQELQRLLIGEPRQSRQIDIPWEDPRLLVTLLKTVFVTGIRKRIGARRQDRHRAAFEEVQKTIEIGAAADIPSAQTRPPQRATKSTAG